MSLVLDNLPVFQGPQLDNQAMVELLQQLKELGAGSVITRAMFLEKDRVNSPEQSLRLVSIAKAGKLSPQPPLGLICCLAKACTPLKQEPFADEFSSNHLCLTTILPASEKQVTAIHPASPPGHPCCPKLELPLPLFEGPLMGIPDGVRKERFRQYLTKP